MRVLLAAIAGLRGGVDRALGRVTAVVLVAAVLWVIIVVALVMMLVGALPFDPLAGVVSLLVAVAATLGGAWAAGAAVRARPELESVLVTAFLVFLLFDPKLEAPDLLSVAIAGLVAGASRYLVVAGGRHLFNPAAFGALLASLLAGSLALAGAPVLSGATWWVATPPLLVLVAVGALIVGYRSSVMTIALAYVLVAVVIRMVQFTSLGLEFWDSLGTVLGSFPIVFAAGFMLTEPQTLPPRSWQRLVVAVVAAVIVSVPFGLGPVHSTPELGLVVANAVALVFGGRRAIRLTVMDVAHEGGSTVALRLRPDRPVHHLAGQAIELAVPHRPRDLRGRRRVLSIASAPGELDLRVAFNVPTRSSTAKRALAALAPGDRLRATRVLGDFVLPRRGTPALLVAGGIGITPFLAMLRAAGPRDDLVLVYRSSEEAPAFLDELAGYGVRVILSCPVAPEPLPDGWTWLGPGRFDTEDLADAVPGLPGRIAFVSGPPGLVASLTAGLRGIGVRRVRRDVFSGA